MGARGPAVAAEGGELGVGGAVVGEGGRGDEVDYWVDKDQGCEKAGVHEGEVDALEVDMLVLRFKCGMIGAYRLFPPKLWPIPMRGRGICLRK